MTFCVHYNITTHNLALVVIQASVVPATHDHQATGRETNINNHQITTDFINEKKTKNNHVLIKKNLHKGVHCSWEDVHCRAGLIRGVGGYPGAGGVVGVA